MKHETDNAVLYRGDCIELAGDLPCADVLLTDPPYAMPTIIAQSRKRQRSITDMSIVETAFRQYFGEFSKVLRDNGRAFVFCDGTFYSVVFRVLYPLFTNTACLVWDKGRIGLGREFRKSHELVIHAWNDSTPKLQGKKTRSDILRHSPVATSERLHPAQKPVSLLREIIDIGGETVFDPFMGSGSTGVAAVMEGRKFVGVEMDEAYFDVARRRIDEAESKKTAKLSKAMF